MSAPTMHALEPEFRAALRLRQAAWDQLMDKDTPAHRAAWGAACDQIDAVLDMRNEMDCE